MQQALNLHKEAFDALRAAVRRAEEAATQGTPEQLQQCKEAVQRAATEHQDALNRAREVVPEPNPERVRSPEEQELDRQLQEGEHLASSVMALLHAWAGELAARERAQHLTDRLRDAERELEEARTQPQQAGSQATQGGRGSAGGERDRPRKVPELKIKHFTGLDKDYTVQQFLFLAHRASRQVGLEAEIFGGYASLDEQLIDARVRCMEGAALDWAVQMDGKFAGLDTWEAELCKEFITMSSAEARAELHSLRYKGGELTTHDAQFRRLSALVDGLSEQEAATAYVRTFASMPEVMEHIERAAPTSWQEAARTAKKEVRILADKKRLQEAATTDRTRRGPGEREQLRAMDAGQPASATPGIGGAPSEELQQLRSELRGLQETLHLMARQMRQPRPPPRPLDPQRFGITAEELQRRLRMGLCFRCGRRDCFWRDCRNPPLPSGQPQQGTLPPQGAQPPTTPAN